MNMPHALLSERREPTRRGPWESIARSNRSLLTLAVLVLSIAGTTGPAAAGCGGGHLPVGTTALQRTELFLGLSLPDGHVVRPQAWARFERDMLGPMICGYAVVDARGGWLGPNGRLLRERAKIVIIIHPPDALPAITAVAEAWRSRFHQDAVLRVTQPVEGGLVAGP